MLTLAVGLMVALSVGTLLPHATATRQASTNPPRTNTSLSPALRAARLLARMTLDDKIAMLHGVPGSPYVGKIPANPRLGIPALKLEDGPAGVGDGMTQVTQLPGPIAGAATWDPSLMQRYGAVIGAEQWAKGANVDLGPTVNIIRDPRWGRAFEAMGEDPYLVGALAGAEIKGVQSQGVLAQVKHVAVYNQETNRNTPADNAIIDERTLEEIYLPQFQAAVNAGVASAMCAYSTINGSYACQNQPLIRRILDQQFGFPGFVTSDWFAAHSTVGAANAGLDMEMPTGLFFGDALKHAVASGAVSIATIDDAVRRILLEMFRFGLFDRQQGGTPSSVATSPAHARVARDVAEQGTVLLKNSNRILPLNPSRLKSIAVIGESGGARPMSAGGGSASVNPPCVVTPLASITRRAGSGVSVRYAPGPSTDGSLPAVQPQSLIPPSGRGHGLHGAYWANTTKSGPPALVRTDRNVNFTFYAQSPGPGIPATRWSAQWTGSIDAKAAGTYQFSLRSDGGSRLYIDNRLVIDDRSDRATATATGSISLRVGSHALKVDYHQDGGGSISLGWQPANAPTPLQQATKLAANSDVAVVFASDSESEFVDRGSLELPGSQDRLIAAVARANPHTVVVLNTGDPVLMPWIGAVPGLIEAWYPGQEDGNALAAVLFGDVNPSGKLPVTFPASQSDLPTNTPQQWPGSNGKVLYSRGLDVGYRWYDAEHIAPLFPFGYGISYTTFSFANLDLAGPASSAKPVTRLTINGADELAAENAVAARAAIQDTGTNPTSSRDTRANLAAARAPRIRLSFHLTNTGRRGGADVAQIYLALPTSTGEPPRRLVGFQRVDLAPGQTRRVTVTLSPADHPLAYWDTGTHSWQIAKGVYHLYVGDSSRNLKLTGSLLVV